MAGDWIKMRVDLSEDPAVITMSDALGMDEFAVVGRLHRVWSWADQHTTDGRASVTAARIDRIAQKDGFAQQMQRVGWLEIEESCVTFPSFNRHNGKSAKRRATETTRKKRVRKMSAKCPQNVRMESGQNADQRREEKRREDIQETASAVSSNARTKFVPPTVEEVAAHCLERKNGIDAEHFVNSYQRQGWKLSNGQAMKDWRAAIVTWEKNNRARAGPSVTTARQTAGDHNQQSADIVRERMNAARQQLETRPAGGFLGFSGDQDEP